MKWWYISSADFPSPPSCWVLDDLYSLLWKVLLVVRHIYSIWPAHGASSRLTCGYKALDNPIYYIAVLFYNPWEVRQKLTSGSDEFKRSLLTLLYPLSSLLHWWRGGGRRACSTWRRHFSYWHVHIFAFFLLTELQGNPWHFVDKQTKTNKWI